MKYIYYLQICILLFLSFWMYEIATPSNVGIINFLWILTQIILFFIIILRFKESIITFLICFIIICFMVYLFSIKNTIFVLIVMLSLFIISFKSKNRQYLIVSPILSIFILVISLIWDIVLYTLLFWKASLQLQL